MSSAAHEPVASTEKPLLEPISTSTEHTDFLPAEAPENLSKTQHAKSIGTTTPEVEGEEQQLVAAMEDYPTTPVSAVDPKSYSPLRLMVETSEPEPEKVPLPPSSSLELSSSLNTKEAEEKSLPTPDPLEMKHLEEAHEPQSEAEDVSAKIKDEQLLKGEEENEEKSMVYEGGRLLETTAATADLPQAEEGSKLVETEYKLHSDDTEPRQAEDNILGQVDVHLQKEEISQPEVIQTAEPENHIPDAVSSLEPVSAISIPATVDGGKLLVEGGPGLEVEGNSSKIVTQDTKGIGLDSKSDEVPKDSTAENTEFKEVEVQEEVTSLVEVTSTPEATNEVPVPSEPEPEVVKEALPELVEENPEKPHTLLGTDEAPKASETVEVGKEEPETEETYGKAIPESTSAEAPGPVAETKVEEEKAVESNETSGDTPVVEAVPTVEETTEETPFFGIGVAKDASESMPHAKTKETENFGPQVVALEEDKAVEEKPTAEDKVAVEENPTDEELSAVDEAPKSAPDTETGNVTLIEDELIIEEVPLVEELPAGGETPESKTEEVKTVVSEPTALDEPVVEESPAVKDTIPIEEALIIDEAPGALEMPVSEAEVISVEAETVEAVPIKEEAAIAELDIEDPLVVQEKPNPESIPDDGLVVEPVPIEETKAVGDELGGDELVGAEPGEVINPLPELKEAAAAEPVFGLSDETQEFKPEELQTESTAAAVDQDYTITPIPVIEDSTLVETETKKDQHSEELKGPENVEAVEILKEEAPEDLGAVSMGETASEGLLVVDSTPEPTAVIEGLSAKGDVGGTKADPLPGDMAAIEGVLEDGLKSGEIAQPAVEGQTVEEESVTMDDEPANKEIIIPEEDPVKEIAIAEEDLVVQELTTSEDASTVGEMVSLAAPKAQQETQEEGTEVIVPVEESEVGKSVEPENGAEVESEETQAAVPAVGIEEQAKEPEVLDEEALTAEITTIVDSGKGTLGVLVEVPDVVAELTAENQQSHVDGPDATLGQQDTFEKHMADTEPDKPLVVEEPSTLEIIPSGEAVEPVSAELEGEVLSESQEKEMNLPEESAEAEEKQEELAGRNHEIEAEQISATQTLAIEETTAVQETFAVVEVSSAGEDDTVIISHGDAKLEDVAEAEAAVKSSDPAGSEEPEHVVIAAEPVPEQKIEITESLPQSEDPKEEQADIHKELKVTPVDVTAERGIESLYQEVFINPIPASETAGNPINLAPGEKVPEFDASSINANVKLDLESYQKADASNFGVKHDAEPEEVFSINPLPAFGTSVNPIDLQPGDPVPDLTALVGSTVMLDGGSYGKADPSNFGVKPEAATAVGPEEFSVKPLPASEAPGNPIELQPGEPIPQIGFVSIGSNVKLDEESYEHADASNFGIKSKAGTGIQSEEFSLPASETVANLVELKPGEPFPQIGSSLIESNIKLDQESYEQGDASNLGVKSSSELVDTTESSTGPVDTDIVAKENNVKETPQDDGPTIGPDVEAPSVKAEATESEVKDIGLEESPAPAETKGVEAGLFVDRSAGEVIVLAESESESITGIITASVLGGGAAIVALTSEGDALSSEPIDNTLPAVSTEIGKEEAVAKHADEEFIMEPAPQTTPSPVHGLIVPEADTTQVLEDVGISGAPAIVVSSPPTSSAVGKQQDEENRTVEVIEPIPEVTTLESMPKAVERESENTPEGVRRRLAESTSLSRPVSSGNDTVSTRRNKNVMRTFWNFLLFGWLGGLGGFGRLFGFGKSKKSQRATQ